MSSSSMSEPNALGNAERRSLHADRPAPVLLIQTVDVPASDNAPLDTWRAEHRGEETERRFWAKSKRTEGCWYWLGARSHNGYGYTHWMGKTVIAHRLAWTLTNGPIPKGLLVCHHCDNRLCVRPDHMFLGTAIDNVADMYAKGRQGTSRRSLPSSFAVPFALDSTAPTERQMAVFRFVAERIEADGCPPSIREICEHFEIRSTNGALDHLRALRRKGFIDWERGKQRTLRLLIEASR